MSALPLLPHADVVYRALRIARGRLDGKGKLAIDAGLLKHMLLALAAALPFDEEFYRATYPDLAAAHDRGDILDLHRHYVEAGFLEGRFGCNPAVDPNFYLGLYPDVGQAIAAGGVRSAAEHFVISGAAEGRAPNAGVAPDVIRWLSVLRPDA